jgi:uncharacterized protein (DUF2235 family)
MLRIKIAAVAVALLVATSPSYAKKIVISIDGTKNDPEDAYSNERALSNVFKLHLFLGGGKKTNDTLDINSEVIPLYYIGVGNEERQRGWLSSIDAKLESILAIKEPSAIHDEAMKDLNKYYKKDDELYVFGFSRGAAIARRLVQRLSVNGIDVDGENVKPKVQFLGVWDTVSAGIDFREVDGAINELEEGEQLSDKIELAYHLVSIDDNRKLFDVTLMPSSNTAHEVWFAGVHADVGGGYVEKGLSDISLQFMKDKIKSHLPIAEIPDIQPLLTEYAIETEKVKLDPREIAQLHKHIRPPGLHIWRDIRVIGDETKPPMIHSSVIRRMEADVAALEGDVKDPYEPENVIKLGGDYQKVP